jgi:hypothetical protein
MKRMMMSDLKVYSWTYFDMLIDGMGVDGKRYKSRYDGYGNIFALLDHDR